jgi:hypothetical protein
MMLDVNIGSVYLDKLKHIVAIQQLGFTYICDSEKAFGQL